MMPLKENNGELMENCVAKTRYEWSLLHLCNIQRTSGQVNETWKCKIMELAKILDNKQRMIWCDIKQT